MFSGLFHKKVRYPGPVVDLIQEQDLPPDRYNDQVRSILYSIYLHGTNIKVGNCDLRIGESWTLYYAGHIGYNINPMYRGHHYALEACRVLLPIAKAQYGFEKLWITCSPDNIASRKTLEKLGGALIAVDKVPEAHWLYQRGETVKNIYEYVL